MKRLLIDVSDLLDESGLEKRVKKTIDLTYLSCLDQQLSLAQPISIDLEIRNTGDRLLSQGNIRGQLWLECSRCLTSYRADFSLEVVESYCSKNKCEGEEDTREMVGGKIDLCPVIDEGLRLWVPMKNLCRDNCKGLCAKCGKNLNEKECDCSRSDIDTRLKVLEDYFPKGNKT